MTAIEAQSAALMTVGAMVTVAVVAAIVADSGPTKYFQIKLRVPTEPGRRKLL